MMTLKSVKEQKTMDGHSMFFFIDESFSTEF